MRSLKPVTRFLRKPKVIVAEIVAITVAAVLGATIPQVGSEVAAAPLAGMPEWVVALIETLALDHVFGSVWFLALVLLSACSLALALSDQWRRAWRLWRRPVTWERMANAPFRREIDIQPPDAPRERREFIGDSMRLGLWGSPLFHLGLMLLIIAGLLRMLFGADAVVDLYEGETLEPSPAAYGAQWPGRLAQPFHLREPLTLRELQIDTYENGGLRQLAAEMELGGETRTVAINEPLAQGASVLYLTSMWGPTALIVNDPEGESQGHALLLHLSPDGRYKNETTLPDGTRIIAAARRLDPTSVDIRVTRDGALLASERLAPGENRISLPGGARLELRGIVNWARFTGRRDYSEPVLYGAFVFVLVGACFMYGVIRVESVVVWEPTPEGARLRVAMRPQRVAPLFAGRFERLVTDSRAELEAVMKERIHEAS